MAYRWISGKGQGDKQLRKDRKRVAEFHQFERSSDHVQFLTGWSPFPHFLSEGLSWHISNMIPLHVHSHIFSSFAFQRQCSSPLRCWRVMEGHLELQVKSMVCRKIRMFFTCEKFLARFRRSHEIEVKWKNAERTSIVHGLAVLPIFRMNDELQSDRIFIA